MGKGRRPRKQRKAVSKWSFDWISVFQGACLSSVIAFLFYKSLLGLFVAAGVIPFWLKLRADEKAKKHRADMLMEFKEYMMLIVASLQTGYSLEKALRQSESELKRLYPAESVLLPFVHVMNQRIGMNMQLEKAFFEFAKEVDLEEAISLAEIISFAKRSGGNYGKNIRDTAFKIEENLSVKQEIETITTEKRLELKVMCVMPLAILAYITITSSSFIAPLYGNALGILIMTACLIAYGLLIMLGRRIIEIKI